MTPSLSIAYGLYRRDQYDPVRLAFRWKVKDALDRRVRPGWLPFNLFHIFPSYVAVFTVELAESSSSPSTRQLWLGMMSGRAVLDKDACRHLDVLFRFFMLYNRFIILISYTSTLPGSYWQPRKAQEVGKVPFNPLPRQSSMKVRPTSCLPACIQTNARQSQIQKIDSNRQRRRCEVGIRSSRSRIRARR